METRKKTITFTEAEIESLVDEYLACKRDAKKQEAARPMCLLIGKFAEYKQFFHEKPTSSAFLADVGRNVTIEGKNFAKYHDKKSIDQWDAIKAHLQKVWEISAEEAMNLIAEMVNSYHQSLAPSPFQQSITHLFKTEGDYLCSSSTQANYYMEDKKIHLKVELKLHLTHIDTEAVEQIPGTITLDYVLKHEGFQLQPGYPAFSNPTLKAMMLAPPRSLTKKEFDEQMMKARREESQLKTTSSWWRLISPRAQTTSGTKSPKLR